jgi:hypothetical protein
MGEQARTIRVYDWVDSQMILEDFYAKLKCAAQSSA